MHHIMFLKLNAKYVICSNIAERSLKNVSEFENTFFVFRDDSVYGGEGNELVWVNEKSIARETFQSRKVVVRNYY